MTLFSPATPEEFLSTQLSERMKRNPRYSLRAFAQSLELSPGALSEVLRGKRKLTLKSAQKITRSLGLNAAESQTFLEMVRDKSFVDSAPEDSPLRQSLKTRQLTVDLFQIVSEWHCFAILSLAETRGFSWEPQKIARRLGISEIEARTALERLERVGLIERHPCGKSGQLHLVPDYVLSSDGVPSQAVRSFHRQILDKAKIALDEQSLDEREISGVTFAVDPNELPRIKKEIHSLLDRCVERASRLDPRRKTEVYHLETAFFRLSRPEGK